MNRYLLRIILILGALVPVILMLGVCISNRDKMDSLRLRLFICGVKGSLQAIYESPNPASKRVPFTTTSTILAAFRDESAPLDTQYWHCEEIGERRDTAIGYLPSEAIHVLSPEELKVRYKTTFEGFHRIGIGGLFSTYYVMLEDLDSDGTQEVLVKKELAQSPASPWISIYRVAGKDVKICLQKQLIGDEFLQPVFALENIDRDLSKEILFFQPYGKSPGTNGLLIYKWDGKAYRSVSTFTPLGLLYFFKSYSGEFLFYFLIIAPLLAILSFLLWQEKKKAR